MAGHDGCPNLEWHWMLDLQTRAGLDSDTAKTVIEYMVNHPPKRVNKLVIIWKRIEPYVCI
jgi:hypothetical protein